MKAIEMLTSEGFDFDNRDKLSKIYEVLVYTELSDQIRAVTTVCRNGLRNVSSHRFIEMGESIG